MSCCANGWLTALASLHPSFEALLFPRVSVLPRVCLRESVLREVFMSNEDVCAASTLTAERRYFEASPRLTVNVLVLLLDLLSLCFSLVSKLKIE